MEYTFPHFDVNALPLHGKSQEERLRLTSTRLERHHKKVRHDILDVALKTDPTQQARPYQDIRTNTEVVTESARLAHIARSSIKHNGPEPGLKPGDKVPPFTELRPANSPPEVAIIMQTLSKLEALNRFVAQDKIRVIAAAVKEPARRPMPNRPHAATFAAPSRRMTDPIAAPTAPAAMIQGGRTADGHRQGAGEGLRARRVSMGYGGSGRAEDVAPVANMIGRTHDGGGRQNAGSVIDASRDPRNRR